MKRILGFFGGDSQAGTTMLARSVAESLQERKKRVLLIMGSGKYGEEFSGIGQRHSIDDLKAGIISGRVTYEDIQQSVEEVRGIYVLPGVRNPLTAKYFPENTYEVMLSAVEEQFDYVILDGGDDANLGLMISGLNMSEHRFFVTTQQSKSIRRLELLRKNITEPLGIEGKLIINKYIRDPSLLLKHDILQLCGQEEAFTVPYIEYGWQAELEGKTLRRFRRFGKAVDRITDCLEPGEKGEKRGSLWKLKKNSVWKNT